MVASVIQVSSLVYISKVPGVGSAILSGLLNKKFAKVELAPGPPLSQIATGASGSVAGYNQKKSS